MTPAHWYVLYLVVCLFAFGFFYTAAEEHNIEGLPLLLTILLFPVALIPLVGYWVYLLVEKFFFKERS